MLVNVFRLLFCEKKQKRPDKIGPNVAELSQNEAKMAKMWVKQLKRNTAQEKQQTGFSSEGPTFGKNVPGRLPRTCDCHRLSRRDRLQVFVAVQVNHGSGVLSDV